MMPKKISTMLSQLPLVGVKSSGPAALTALSWAVADMRETQNRTHQAAAARLGAERLACVAPVTAGRHATAGATPDTTHPTPRRQWRTAAFDDTGKDTGG